jgi:hypothetical protein
MENTWTGPTALEIKENASIVELSIPMSSVVDPDPDRVGSTAFCQIRIGINSKKIKDLTT